MFRSPSFFQAPIPSGSREGLSQACRLHFDFSRNSSALMLDYQPTGAGSLHVIEFTLQAAPSQILLAVPHRRTWSHSKADEHWEGEPNRVAVEMEPEGLLEVFYDPAKATAHCGITASDYQQAVALRTALLQRFKPTRKRHPKPEFQVLYRNAFGDLDFNAVAIRRSWRRSNSELDLLYGPEFTPWANRLGKSLRDSEPGIILLSGEPGTGKTCFLRHLAATHSHKVRFMYLPPVFLSSIASPELATTWIEKAGRDPRPMVILIEDAEDLLLDAQSNGTRSTATSNLLNATDGLLGDLIKAKIICSFNCPASKLDKAIVRPGRLKAAWRFESLARERAERVKEKYQLPPLPGKARLTLAEIFMSAASLTSFVPEAKPIGFAGVVEPQRARRA